MRRTTILIVLLIAALTYTLFKVKYGVQHLESELNSINRAIHSHQETIHVLQAEWSHLNEPERLRKLAAKHLNFEALSSGQIGSVADFPITTGSAAQINQNPVPSEPTSGTHLTSGRAQ